MPQAKSAQEVMEEGECQTCKERKYQDGSDDPGLLNPHPRRHGGGIGIVAQHGGGGGVLVGGLHWAGRRDGKYQDGSDDPGVSFKTPTNIAPEQAASAVRGHENEHVVREQAKARQEGRKGAAMAAGSEL